MGKTVAVGSGQRWRTSKGEQGLLEALWELRRAALALVGFHPLPPVLFLPGGRRVEVPHQSILENVSNHTALVRQINEARNALGMALELAGSSSTEAAKTGSALARRALRDLEEIEEDLARITEATDASALTGLGVAMYLQARSLLRADVLRRVLEKVTVETLATLEDEIAQTTHLSKPHPALPQTISERSRGDRVADEHEFVSATDLTRAPWNVRRGTLEGWISRGLKSAGLGKLAPLPKRIGGERSFKVDEVRKYIDSLEERKKRRSITARGERSPS